MHFNEDYKRTMQTIAETGQSVAAAYAETQNESAANSENQTTVDWGKLVNTFGTAAQNYLDNRNAGERRWNDFEVNAKIDEGTQKVIIFVVVLAVGALLFYGFRKNRK